MAWAFSAEELFRFRTQTELPVDVEEATHQKLDTERAPRLLTIYSLKDAQIDEILPLLIILAHRRPEVKQFYDRIMTFIVNLAKTGRTSWIGNLMSLKLTVNVMERFGLIPLGVAASYDAGISWAVATAAATEVFSDIQIADIVETLVAPEKKG